jgi:hypothetical protein
LEKPFSDGWFAKAAYSYGESKNTVDPGSIAFGSWNSNPHAGDPNNPGLGFSANSPRHRVFASLSYSFGNVDNSGDVFGATSVSLFWEGFTQGNTSYVFGGDLNGDGGTSNDLIYIHNDISEMNFEEYTASGVTFTRDQQTAAWENFIEQDEYLSEHRGEYAERGGVFLPMVFRADFSLMQDVYFNLFNKRNAIQLRLDILNVGNFLNKEWGVGQNLISNQPLIPRGADAEGKAQYRLRNIGTELMSKTLQQTLIVADVYRIQFGVRYTFN